ncbi:MAG: toll/interleukin-1 receptor domain-containing protein [Rhodothermales bacterium]|nr:toll/interleukin-1 receptor domain-containing protein [Rhodothermales bacterium]
MTTTTSNRTVSKLRVFLSYRTVEARFADVLKEHLIKDFIGLVEVFLASDTTSVPAGSHWLEEVVKGLRQAQLHLIICSHYSVYRPWINYEAGAARVRGIPIVPLCHSGLNPDQLPVPLSESESGVLTEATTIEKLYTRIAELIGSDIPDVDFQRYAEEFKILEAELEALERECAGETRADGDSPGGSEPELIQDPQVLCVTSRQFRELGFANQLQIVLDAFPKNIRHDVVLNSTDLSAILLEEQVDIVHIAAFVCPRGGDLYFSPVELPLGRSCTDDPDILTPEALVTLLKKSRTRLVVLGGSESLVLATELLPVTHVIAARDMVSAKAMARWVDTFYRTLAVDPLDVASDIASRVSQAPMKLYTQQSGAPVLFGLVEGKTRAAMP